MAWLVTSLLLLLVPPMFATIHVKRDGRATLPVNNGNSVLSSAALDDYCRTRIDGVLRGPHAQGAAGTGGRLQSTVKATPEKAKPIQSLKEKTALAEAASTIEDLEAVLGDRSHRVVAYTCASYVGGI